ncbi:hypothetical protein LCGC14_2163610, partial [marine sediment metagenome]
AGAHFKVVRKNADTPIVEVFSGLDQMINGAQHYEIYAFLVDSASYQLYYLDVTTQNSTIFFNVYVNSFDDYLDTGGQVSDAGMVECQYSMYMYNHETSPPNISVNFGKKPDDRTMQIDTLGNIRSGANSLATVSNIPGALSMILIEEGSFTWASMAVNVESITGLDGNSHEYYILYYEANYDATAMSSSLMIFFNNDFTAKYSERLIENGTSIVSNNTTIAIRFLFNNAVADRFGTGSFKIKCKATNGNVDGTQEGTGATGSTESSVMRVYNGSYRYAPSANITQINFRPLDSFHDGANMSYRLYRLA